MPKPIGTSLRRLAQGNREDMPLLRKAENGMESTMQADRILDLGEKGCSRLLQDIADSFSTMSSGQTLLVLAHDPAAPLDIKVWSKQTGNPLLQSDLANGCFLLRKK